MKTRYLLPLISCFFGMECEAQAKEIVINTDEIQSIVDAFKGITISGQATAIYQTSNLHLKVGDLKNTDGSNLTAQELTTYDHKDGSGSFSATIGIEKKFNDNELFHVDIQFANGAGVDAPLQGGAMLNNDIMEDINTHNEIYLAKAFYERNFNFSNDYNITFNIGKMGVNDFFDVGDENSDQTTQFLNQAIANNGAFDYVQDLQGHGYTYGSRLGIANDFVGFDLGFFSADSYLDNINKKHSILGAITFTPKFGELAGTYQFYVFSNRGEYAAFNDNGELVSKDANIGTEDSAINTEGNVDDLNKNGFGISITQALSENINMFAKYGKQDDDRDVRHYQDMDESYMIGANFNGTLWSRHDDKIGVAYEVGRLTGNHRKAHQKGYSSFFERVGIGAGNYGDESVIEAYYKIGLTKNSNLSFDFQNISNFYYSKQIGNVQSAAVRFTTGF